MKHLYMSPKTETAVFNEESILCQSAVDKGLGAIDLVTESDYDGDVWSTIY